MLPFGIGFSEIFVVFLVLIVFVGPEGIPQAVRAIAKVIRAVRSMVDEVRYSEEFDEVKREILQPLEEARRFNPKRKAEEWVRREIEEPMQLLTKEHVSDFKSAIEEEATLKVEAKDHQSSEEDLMTKEPMNSDALDLHSEIAKQDITDLSEDEKMYEDDQELAIATTDPLDRGLDQWSGETSEKEKRDHG